MGNKKKKKKNKKGFTLVELIAVIAIIGIIATIATVTFTSIAKRAKEKNYEAIVGTIQVASMDFYDATKVGKFYVQTLIDYGLLRTDNNMAELTNPINDQSMNCYIVDISDDDFKLTESSNCSNDIYDETRPIIKFCNSNETFDSNNWYFYKDVCLEPKLPNKLIQSGISIVSYRWDNDNDGNTYFIDTPLRFNFNTGDVSTERYTLTLQLSNPNISVAPTRIVYKTDIDHPRAEIIKGINCGNGFPITITYTDKGSGLKSAAFDSDQTTTFTDPYSFTKEYVLTSNADHVTSVRDNTGVGNSETLYYYSKNKELYQDPAISKISIIAKNSHNNVVNSGVWSRSGLYYTIDVDWGNDLCAGTIKYCIDYENTCTPNTTIQNHGSLMYEISRAGIYYVRVDAINKDNVIQSSYFKAQVDDFVPTCVNSENNSWTKDNVVISYGCETVGASGCYVGGHPSLSQLQKSYTETAQFATLSAYLIYSNTGSSNICNDKSVSIYLDKTNPAIYGLSITDLGDKKASIEVSATDIHSGIKKIRYYVNDKQIGVATEYAVTNSSRNQYETNRIHNKEIDFNTIDLADTYTIKVEVEDAVGNVSSATKSFTPHTGPAETASVGTPNLSALAIYQDIDITNKVTLTNMTRSSNGYIRSNKPVKKLGTIKAYKSGSSNLLVAEHTGFVGNIAVDYSKTTGDMNRNAEIIFDNNFVFTYKLPERGDLNFDNVIDKNDYNILNNYHSGTSQLTSYQRTFADVNCDGYLNSPDVTLVNQIANGTATLGTCSGTPGNYTLHFVFNITLYLDSNNYLNITKITMSPASYVSNDWTNQKVMTIATPRNYRDYEHIGYNIGISSLESTNSNYFYYSKETTTSGVVVKATDYGKSQVTGNDLISYPGSVTVKIDKTPPVFNSSFQLPNEDVFGVVQCWQSGGKDGVNSNTWPGSLVFGVRSINSGSCVNSKDNYNSSSTQPRYKYIHYPIKIEHDSAKKTVTAHFCQYANKLSKYSTYFSGVTFAGFNPYQDSLSGINYYSTSTRVAGDEIKSYSNGKSYCGSAGAPCIREYTQTAKDRAGNEMPGYKIYMVTHYYPYGSINEWNNTYKPIGNSAQVYGFDCRTVSSLGLTDTYVVGQKEVYQNGSWVIAGYCRNEECTSGPYTNFPRTVAP